MDGYGLHVADRPLANPEQAPNADRFAVTPGFFETLRVPLVRGGFLDPRDAQGVHRRRSVVNRTPGRGDLPGGGGDRAQRSAWARRTLPPRTIVGIVGDVRHQGLDTPPGYQVYVPQAQWIFAETQMTIVLRAGERPCGPRRAVCGRSCGRWIRPSPSPSIERYTDVVAATTGTRRFATALLGLFAGSAVLPSPSSASTAPWAWW